MNSLRARFPKAPEEISVATATFRENYELATLAIDELENGFDFIRGPLANFQAAADAHARHVAQSTSRLRKVQTRPNRKVALTTGSRLLASELLRIFNDD
jgi:hypothetical protein